MDDYLNESPFAITVSVGFFRYHWS